VEHSKEKKTRGMKISGSISMIFCVAALVMLPCHRAESISDQTSTERLLKENRRFIGFLNVCMTNFLSDRVGDLKKAYEKNFNAEVAYLQSDFKRAYTLVYSSQGEMEKLYRDLIRSYYLEDSKTILDKIAPSIIRSKNQRARLDLSLGYRDRTVGYYYYTTGEASNPRLYAYKLSKYQDAISMLRRAKRFAFLALYKSQGIGIKRKIYNQLCKSERSAGNRFFNRFIDLNEDEYIKEMNKSYGENSEAEAKTKEAVKSETPRKEGEATAEKESAAPGSAFETNVERRVRFRSEALAARYIINGGFDQAEDIMRQYIPDFNFKLINATLEVLSSPEGGVVQDEQLDYAKMRVHLMDNYLRLAGKSLIDGFAGTITVEDNVAEGNREKQGSEAKLGGKQQEIKTGAQAKEGGKPAVREDAGKGVKPGDAVEKK
jgi:hypothetical protein